MITHKIAKPAEPAGGQDERRIRAAALALLPEQTQEEIFRYYFLRQPQRVIGVHIGRTRSTAGRHKIRYLLDRQCSIIKSTTIKIYGGKYEKEIQHVA